MKALRSAFVLFIADRDRVEWVVMGAALVVWIGMCIAGVAA